MVCLKKSEAETFADIARLAGVPSDAILVETRSTNSGEKRPFHRAVIKRERHPMRIDYFSAKAIYGTPRHRYV